MNHPRWQRLLAFVRRDVAADVDEEIAFHLAMLAERNRALGMDDDEARQRARARFGAVEPVRDAMIARDRVQHRRQARRSWLQDLASDARFGVRALRRSPAFTVTALATLALTIGANAAMFSVVDAVALRPLPFDRPSELVTLGDGSAGEYAALRERLRAVSDVGMSVAQTHPIDAGGGSETARVTGAAITPNVLSILGATPAHGRAFTDDDAQLGANSVLLLSDGYWRRQFGGADVLGRQVQVEGAPFTIVGVMQPDFAFPDRSVEYWMPYAMNPANPGLTWAVGGRQFIARLAPGTPFEAAQREVAAVWPTLRTLNPLWDPGESYRSDVRIQPLQDAIVGSAGGLVWLLFGSVAVVLLVGCVNVANLLLVRAASREREFALRSALGGGRGRLVRQMLTESVLLAVTGAVAAVVLAWGMLRAFVLVLPAGVPRAETIALNTTTLLFTAAVAVLAGLAFGMVPALRATSAGGSGVDLATASRNTRPGLHRRMANALVAAEMALAVVLAVSATLLLRSFHELRQVQTGIRTDQVIAARVTPPATGATPERLTALYGDVLRRVRALPGVESAAAVDKLPLSGEPVWGLYPRIEGQFEDATRQLPEIRHYQSVSDGYFGTLGIRVLQGRAFTAGDDARGQPVAMVSESVARQFWPAGDAVGQRIGYPYNSEWMTIVGVVEDVRQNSARDSVLTSVYTPLWQRSTVQGTEAWVALRAAGEPAALATAIRSAVHDADRSVAVSDVQAMSAFVSRTMDEARFVTLVCAFFAGAALLLGGVGVYGVTAYAVSQRKREIGVRMALGARPAGVLGLVVGGATSVAAVGAVAGVGLSLLATRVLRGWLFGISESDPVTMIGVPVFFLAVAALASVGPARAGARVDAATVLRSD